MTLLELTINTAIEPYFICISSDNHPLYEKTALSPRQFTETLIDEIKKGCITLNSCLTDISVIGIVKGPGSYTGIRLGLSCAKTLALHLNCPIYGFTSLTSMAYTLPIMPSITGIAIGGKKNECYFQLFNHVNHKLHEVSSPVNLAKDELEHFLKKFNSPLTVIGSLPVDFSSITSTLKNITYINQSITGLSLVKQLQLRKTKESEFNTLVPYYFHAPTIGKKKR